MSLNNSNETLYVVSMNNTHLIVFWIFIVIFIPSIFCFCFIFIQIIRKRILKRHIHSHIIFVILVCNFLQVSMEHPIFFSYLYNGTSIVKSDSFCIFWSCLEFFFNGTILMLMCYGSIERYLLIFHRNMVHQHLILLHYIPILFFIAYPLILYIILICFYPCMNSFDYAVNTCGGPCYLFEKWASIFDTILNLALPLFICTITNILLLIRVLRQKHRMRQQQIWKKNKRLIIQLLSIVILHNIVWFPTIISLLIILFSPVTFPILINMTLDLYPYGYYMVAMLCPFISIIGLPELWLHYFNNVIQPTNTNRNIRTIIPR